MISVVIPCFNERPDRLKRTVCSALDSIDLARGDEVIVANDAGDPVKVPEPAKVVTLPVNRGAAGAFNAGLDAASGRYIARLDVGDVFYPEPKQRQFSTVIDGDVPASFSPCVNERDGKERHPLPEWNKLMQRDGQFFVSTTVVRRDVCQKARSAEQFRIGDDWFWTYLIHRICGWSMFAETTGTATDWPGGLSDRYASIRRAEIKKVRKAILNARWFTGQEAA